MSRIGVREALQLGASLLLLASCNELLGLDPGQQGAGGSAGEPVAGMGATGGTAGATGGTAGATGGTGASSGASGAGTGASSGDGSAVGGKGGSGAGRGGSDAGDGGTGGFADGACARNSDCIAQGFDWPGICRSGRCVDITTDDCNIVMGAEHLSTQDEPVIFGVLAKGLVPANVERYLAYWDFKLAMDEFFENRVNRGGIPIGGVNRRPLLVMCHDASDPEGWTGRSLDHLIENVGVPGIIAMVPPSDLTGVATYTFGRGQDVFFLHFSGTDANLANLEDGGRVWHMLGNELDVAPSYVPLVERVEAKVNPLGVANRRPTRLVVLQSSGNFFFGARLWLPLDATLRINGALARDQDQENYFVVSPEGHNWDETAEIVASHEPDIVVDLSGLYDASYIIDPKMLQRGLPAPYYVVTGVLSHSANLLYLMYLDPSLRTRVVGVNTAAAEDTSMYDAFLARARLVVPPVVNVAGTENFYDPIYYLFYAAAAAGTDGTLTGTKLGAAMKRLIRGERHDIGPDEIPTIFDILTNPREPDATIGFYATMGAPVFDEQVGARIVGGSVYCVRDDLSFAWDVLRYDQTTRSLYGTFPCFDF